MLKYSKKHPQKNTQKSIISKTLYVIMLGDQQYNVFVFIFFHSVTQHLNNLAEKDFRILNTFL